MVYAACMIINLLLILMNRNNDLFQNTFHINQVQCLFKNISFKQLNLMNMSFVICEWDVAPW